MKIEDEPQMATDETQMKPKPQISPMNADSICVSEIGENLLSADKEIRVLSVFIYG